MRGNAPWHQAFYSIAFDFNESPSVHTLGQRACEPGPLQRFGQHPGYTSGATAMPATRAVFAHQQHRQARHEHPLDALSRGVPAAWPRCQGWVTIPRLQLDSESSDGLHYLTFPGIAP